MFLFPLVNLTFRHQIVGIYLSETMGVHKFDMKNSRGKFVSLLFAFRQFLCLQSTAKVAQQPLSFCSASHFPLQSIRIVAEKACNFSQKHF